ncbi:sodium-dependent transporter [Oscillospiraceae bacterium NTUH-002-81]|nr:sodium-dependent transporter [Oscillospiraceae bacterium NTUH-002-81]
MGANEHSGESRDVFKNRFGMILSMAGLAIGLGNCWRFPYLCAKWGGGAFVFAYLVGVVGLVAPLAIVEVAMGKGTQKGLVDTYALTFKNKPAGYVLGSVSAFGQWAQNFYYVAIMSAIVYFAVGCGTSIWNRVAPDQIYDSLRGNKPLSIGLYVVLLGILLYTGVKGISKGIEKISNIMVPALFILFIITFVVTVATTPGIVDGLNYYLNPDFSQLANPGLWVAAVGQALFSIGVGPGALLVYGSHIKEHGEITVSVLTICAMDTCAGLLAGLCIIPACIAFGIDPQSGSSLIFKVLPVVFQKMPAGTIVGLLLFVGMFFAAFTSACSNQETAVTSYSDAFHMSRAKVVAIMGVINLAFGIPCLFSNGWESAWQLITSDFFFMPATVLGGIAYAWVFGVKKIRENQIDPDSDIKLGSWFDTWVKFIAVPIMVLLAAYTFIQAF